MLQVEGRIRCSADWLFKHINEAQSKLIEAAEQKQASAKAASARASYSYRYPPCVICICLAGTASSLFRTFLRLPGHKVNLCVGDTNRLK